MSDPHDYISNGATVKKAQAWLREHTSMPEIVAGTRDCLHLLSQGWLMRADDYPYATEYGISDDATWDRWHLLRIVMAQELIDLEHVELVEHGSGYRIFRISQAGMVRLSKFAPTRQPVLLTRDRRQLHTEYAKERIREPRHRVATREMPELTRKLWAMFDEAKRPWPSGEQVLRACERVKGYTLDEAKGQQVSQLRTLVCYASGVLAMETQCLHMAELMGISRSGPSQGIKNWMAGAKKKPWMQDEAIKVAELLLEVE